LKRLQAAHSAGAVFFACCPSVDAFPPQAKNKALVRFLIPFSRLQPMLNFLSHRRRSTLPPETRSNEQLEHPPDSYRDGTDSSIERTPTVLLIVQLQVFDLVQFLTADFGRGKVQQRKCSASKSA